MQKSIRQKLRTTSCILQTNYIRAGESLPVQSHYGDFHQYENGVGMMRDFITGFTRELLKADNLKIRSKKPVLVLTAVSAYPYI
jgi:NifB/MoaA-like Fe-S oxidoreductase